MQLLDTSQSQWARGENKCVFDFGVDCPFKCTRRCRRPQEPRVGTTLTKQTGHSVRIIKNKVHGILFALLEVFIFAFGVEIIY